MVILLGVVGKTMPQINIMTIGFTLKILVGLSALTLAIYAVANASGEVLGDILHEITV